VTINTDDPTLCNTALTKEYSILVKNFNLSYFDLKKLIFNALSSAFLDEKENTHLRKVFENTFIELEPP
jgi:adenosine deaminase